MGGPYGTSSLNMPLPLDQNPFSNPQLPFLATLELHDISSLTNDPIQHNPSWSSILVKITTNIPKFDGQNGKDPTPISTHTIFGVYQIHYWMIALVFASSYAPSLAMLQSGSLNLQMLHLITLMLWKWHS